MLISSYVESPLLSHKVTEYLSICIYGVKKQPRKLIGLNVFMSKSFLFKNEVYRSYTTFDP